MKAAFLYFRYSQKYFFAKKCSASMQVQFFLRFKTDYGQSLWITGNIDSLGNNDPDRAMLMTYLNDEFWHLNLNIKSKEFQKPVSYYYFLKNKDGSIVNELGKDRCIHPDIKSHKEIMVMDTWNHAGAFENVFYTTPFAQTILKENFTKGKAKSVKHPTHIFRIKAPLLQKNEVVCLLGTGKQLGNWNESKPILLERENDWWTTGLDLSASGFPLAYKYGVYNIKEKQFLKFESGNNRLLIGDAAMQKLTVLHDGFAGLPNSSWKGAGICVPVFSLRSASGWGVGDFTDLKLLADWAAESGLKLIQLLPVNDTCSTFDWTDSYPYSAISAFALHPIYLNPDVIAGENYRNTLECWQESKKALNALPDLDYEAVIKLKWEVLHQLYELMKQECLSSKSFQDFFETNKHWLQPYAAFCYLRDENNTTAFDTWNTHSAYHADEISALCNPASDDFHKIAFYYFIQFHLHLQLKEAADYAHQRGIVLKGDIPIGISKNSCDAWVQPALYNMHWQAGAPPDDFTKEGQNWGFPIYNWEEMQKDNYQWWKQRFHKLSEYFDAFRIDHILGFFRIWSIPEHAVQGIMGIFKPCKPVHINEFGEKGIWFDYQRYVRPFITDEIIEEVFGENADSVKENYLCENEFGGFDLLPEFETQQQVSAFFDSAENDSENQEIKNGLLELIANVILFEDENNPGDQFHFRIGMEETLTFKNLIPHVQIKLRELYNDYFFNRQEKEWFAEAMKKLPQLKAATNMLVCGEDLGMVPACVREVMKQLGILSLEVQRMPKNSDKEFIHPDQVPYLSVFTPGTHDMSTIREWWEEDKEKSQRFFNTVLKQHGNAPLACEAWLSRAIVLQHLYSPAIWSIIQIQDILGMNEELRQADYKSERINNPANNKHYWRYRMHISLEELLTNKNFSEELCDYMRQSGRC